MIWLNFPTFEERETLSQFRISERKKMTKDLICRKCGHLFSADEAPRIRGDFICGVCVNGDIICPNCRSDRIETASECICCGKHFPEDEIYDGCCEDCTEALATPHNVIDYCDANDEKTDVEINFATASLLRSCGYDLNEILKDFLISASEHPLLKVRFHKAAKETATRELDLEHFVCFCKELPRPVK